MATGKGVIQGYTGVATVDEQTQIIVDAQAHGTGSEQELLLPVIDAIATIRSTGTIITADAGYLRQPTSKHWKHNRLTLISQITATGNGMNVTLTSTFTPPGLIHYLIRAKQ
jgi:branched-subunit amino acid permease